MTIKLSDKLKMIKPSATIAVSDKAKQLKQQGKDIISLSAGEPDFDTPEVIKQHAIQAIEDGFSKYTQVDGIPELKQAICDKLQNENQLDYQPEQVIVSTGAKQSIYNFFQAIINSGDEVIIPAPYWVSYPDMVRLADGVPVIIESDIDSNFKINAKQLEAAITEKTKALIINSPSNPSGAIYTQAELVELGKVLQKHPNIVILTDDIYEHIYWAAEPFVNLLNAWPDLYSRTVIINGMSKAFAMTGWRLGYAAGPKEIIAAMKKIQSQSTSCANAIAQKAALSALTDLSNEVAQMCDSYQERHDFVYQSLKDVDGIKCLPSLGTFYLFPNVSGLIEKLDLKDDVALADYMLDKIGVAVVPGTAFGNPGYIRLSFATSLDNLKQACQRIQSL